jgi:hypothetical protein
MTDEIRKKQEPTDEPELKQGAADLVGAAQTRPRPAISESMIEREWQPLQSATKAAARDITAVGTHGAATAPAMEHEAGPLFSSSEANDLRGRWDAIQVGFVDEPRRAVEQADNLVAGTMKRLAEVFAEERGRLESQWDQGENVSTEDLRLALRR